MKLAWFTADAKVELLAQTAYYEAIQKGLVARFRTEAEAAAAARAAAFPAHGKPAPRNSGRRRTNDLKFSLTHTETDYRALIHAAAVDHRMPGRFQVRSATRASVN